MLVISKEMSKNLKYKPKIVSLFSGCGGLDLGFHNQGYETVWANDFAHWACETFKQNFGDIIVEKDIEQIDPYKDNMELSQNRARNVLGFLRQQECFIQLETTKKERLQYWLTANGLSYGRTIDANSNLTFNSNTAIDPNKSRRVEFRIVTTSEILVEKVIEQLNR